MSDIDRAADYPADNYLADSYAACCVNAGCGNSFDPAREGFNGECDACAAVAADHLAGAHYGLERECLLCWVEPASAARPLALAA